LEELIGYLDFYADIRIFIKNSDSKYLYVNKAFADMLGVSIDNMIGKGDYDFFSRDMADLYLAEDKKVLAGQKFVNQRWMVPNEKGIISWCISHKQPLKDRNGLIKGIIGTFRDLSLAGFDAKPFFDLSEVVEFMHDHYAENISAEDLASVIGLSVSQLNRKFKNTLSNSPINYLLNVRIQKAVERLLKSDDNITEVSFKCGFNNQTYFNRQFKKFTGLSPSSYRKKYS
jgi:PAS domain S-box-containing protein